MAEYVMGLLYSHPLVGSAPTSGETPAPEPVQSQSNPLSEILEDLSDLEFKLRSYRDLSSDQTLALGVEQGMNLAADMLNRIIERYQG